MADDCPTTPYPTASATLYYNAEGLTYTGTGTSGTYVCEAEFTANGTPVQIFLHPRTTDVLPLDESLVTVRRSPGTPTNEWAPAVGFDVTLTFPVPSSPSSQPYSWEFIGTTQPTPLKLKVKVKPPPP
ncbi:hypothetical protein SAMN02745121_07724 [Nannocystis exedens]|uniref:Uncharacterized protein n=1 Tax=Nannocystis exedens TaxID=54 RepID=A0A1I2H822_9BACT|nr:hypothetical protein [Nannocystis exedens]PCC73988.1 hypothetical protein NAEX_07077 [Nannocystis exedens]SFF24906.1 hypothetical protein SAMN02745121_07724 [Nannocystis exedens]